MKNNLNLDQLKRMSGENMIEDHVHELPGGVFTSGKIEGSDQTHYHEYGEGERTSMSSGEPGHTHETSLGVTSVPA